MATIEDLMRVTHRSRRTVIREIEAGNMPGYRVTSEEGHVSYHIPDEGFDLYCRGYWTPRDERPPIRQSKVLSIRHIDWVGPTREIDLDDPDGSKAKGRLRGNKAKARAARRSPNYRWRGQYPAPTRAIIGTPGGEKAAEILDFGDSLILYRIDPENGKRIKHPEASHGQNRIEFIDRDEVIGVRRLLEWAGGDGSMTKSDTNDP